MSITFLRKGTQSKLDGSCQSYAKAFSMRRYFSVSTQLMNEISLCYIQLSEPMPIHNCTHISNNVCFVEGHVWDLHHVGEAQISRGGINTGSRASKVGIRCSEIASQGDTMGTHCVWTHILPNMKHTWTRA